MKLLEDLNTDQQRAITTEGTVVIMAGPGTGKTKTLTAKIQYLIQEKQVSPESILALTFTKKAASEMRERLSHLSKLPYISTFHALALDFSETKTPIISETERKELITILLQERKEKITEKDIQEVSLLITNHKNELQQSQNAIVEQYNALLQEKNLIDFDDLLIHFFKALQTNSIAEIKSRFQYILVDEFQDTNTLQYEIIKQLLTTPNLFVIGDPLQSIYSFRGANVEIFNQLVKDFPDHTTITLAVNYRSGKAVIDASSLLFPHVTKLQSFVQYDGEVLLVNTINEFTEAEWIVEMIDKKVGGTDLIKAGNDIEKRAETFCFKDFAVMYRSHSFSRVLKQKFTESGIPFQIIGGDSLYEQTEITFIINTIRFLHNNSAEHVYQLLISPVIGVSKESRYKLARCYHQDKKEFIEIIKSRKEQYITLKKDINKISTFLHELEGIDGNMQNARISQIIHKITQIKTMQDYVGDKAPELNNIHMLISIFTQFDREVDSVEKALQYLAYLEAHDYYDQQVDKVPLLSIHAAKGLEFSEVFIVGFEEGNIPSLKSIDQDSIDEEKRLLYVAMTRAKQNLYLISVQNRYKEKTNPSRFKLLLNVIPQIDDEVIEKRIKQQKKWKEKKSQLSLF